MNQKGMDMTTPSGMGGMTGSHHTDMGEMMKMYFHMDYIGETVLFKGWKIHDITTLILSMIGVFVLALLYEALKFGRQWLVEHAAAHHVSRFAQIETRGDPPQQASVYVGTSPLTFWHIAQTLLHMLQAFLSYVLMMVFMTYNGWLCIALILGAGVGYFAFGWRSKVVVEVSDYCH